MIYNKEIADKTAESLLQIKAIKLQPANPFTWASGWNSPIYCDNRKTLSYPQIRTFVRQQFVDIIEANFSNVDVIAGVATGGIALGVLVAQELGLPFVYVRSSAKSHGMQNLIEGELDEGKKVVVIEDLVSTGGSSLKAVEAIRANNCEVLGMTAIFTYGFNIAKNNFDEHDCKLITLSNYESLINVAAQSNYIAEKDIESLSKWRTAPEKWNK